MPKEEAMNTMRWFALWVSLSLLAAAGCSPAIRGNTALKTGDYASAVAEFKAQLKAHPDDLFTRSRLGQAYYRLGKPEKAVAVLEDLLARDPEDPEAPIFLGLSYLALGQRGRGFDAMERYRSNIYREVRNVRAECARLRPRLDVSLDDIERAMFQAIEDGRTEQRQINMY
jgi:tetratricopeptide (TPR) repeat protein